MKVSTLKIIVNMFEAASKDQSRWHLCGVNIKPLKGGKVRIQATDGHILSYVDVLDPELSSHIGESTNFTLSRDLAPSLRLLVKSYKVDADLAIEGGILKDHYGNMASIKPIEGKYPDTDAFIPKIEKTELGEKGVYSVGIDPSLIAKVYKSWGIKKKDVKFTFKDNLGAFTMECKVEDLIYRAVVMPIRV